MASVNAPLGIPTVWFIHMPGCDACALTAPEVVKAGRALQARMRVAFYPIDLRHDQWDAARWGGWMPRVTPTLVFVGSDGRTRSTLESKRSAEEIFNWVAGNMRSAA